MTRKVLVVGAGVVGTATAFGLIDRGHDVTLVDIAEDRVSALQRNGYQAVTPDDMNFDDVDVAFVCVPTPTDHGTGTDLAPVLAATQSIGERIRTATRNFPVIAFRSTVPPGTVRQSLIPLLEETSGKSAGHQFGVVYNPEYLRAAHAREDFLHPRAVTIASLSENDRSHQIVADIVSSFCADIHWLPFEAAELQKYINNVGNAIKISTYNWFRLLADKCGLETEFIQRAFEISVLSAEGLWNPAYGTRDFGPYSGGCLPKDTLALLNFASDLGVDTALIEATQAVNGMWQGTESA
ncbi:2-dehydropantoate 2-reductase N-terminal domain-containing protein [Tsukamurella soli]|uniref:UDP-glucose 6-dehydrogenase n=1 Tax=Tsukamurella soli TaxID=644556 RepID=A0ABP8JEJ2_9ACTN